MTTLVADAKAGFMAADFQVTYGDFATRCETKIYEVETEGGDLYLVGLAGTEMPGFLFLEWFRTGDWESPPEPMSLDDDEAFTAVILGPDGIQIADKYMRPAPVPCRWYTEGTGGAYALAIMEAGCDVFTAMETSLRLDPNSGFGYEIKYLNGVVADFSE